MGMFDSFYDSDGGEWQTKALASNLDRYEIGDGVPSAPIAHQIAVFGGPESNAYQRSFATIRGGFLAAVPAERDDSLPLLDYFGGWLAARNGETHV